MNKGLFSWVSYVFFLKKIWSYKSTSLCVAVCLRLTLDGDQFNGISCVCGFSVCNNFEVDTLDVHHSVYESYDGVGIYRLDRNIILIWWSKSVIKYRLMVQMLEMCCTDLAKVWWSSCFKYLLFHVSIFWDCVSILCVDY